MRKSKENGGIAVAEPHMDAPPSLATATAAWSALVAKHRAEVVQSGIDRVALWREYTEIIIHRGNPEREAQLMVELAISPEANAVHRELPQRMRKLRERLETLGNVAERFHGATTEFERDQAERDRQYQSVLTASIARETRRHSFMFQPGSDRLWGE